MAGSAILSQPPPAQVRRCPDVNPCALTQIEARFAHLPRLRRVLALCEGFSVANLIALWHAEHVRFSRLLDLLETQVADLHEGQTPNFGLMRNIVSYLRDYADRTHHPREDVAFERLVIRDPALRLPVNRLLQEHRVIAVAGEELLERLDGVIVDAVVSRSAIEAAAAQYLAYYRHHLGTEEREILPRAARLLTAQDWDLVAGAAASHTDPLTGDAPGEVYRELREFIAANAPAP